MFVRISFGGHLSHQATPDILLQQDYGIFNLIFETLLTFHKTSIIRYIPLRMIALPKEYGSSYKKEKTELGRLLSSHSVNHQHWS